MIQGKNYGKLKWELVQDPIEIPSSAPVSSITILNLNGAEDGKYKLDWDVSLPSNSSARDLYFRINGDANNYTQRGFEANGSSVVWINNPYVFLSYAPASGSAVTNGSLIINGSNTGNGILGNYKMANARSDMFCPGRGGIRYSGASPITSLNLVMSAGTFYGTFELYKKVI